MRILKLVYFGLLCFILSASVVACSDDNPVSGGGGGAATQPHRPGRRRRQQRHGAFLQQRQRGGVRLAVRAEIPRRLYKIYGLRFFYRQRAGHTDRHGPHLLTSLE